MIPENEPQNIGHPTRDVAKLDADGEHCRGKRAKKLVASELDIDVPEECIDEDGLVSIFRGYCRNHPGKGTDHVGSGRCKFHDGPGSGKDNPAWKHGLYSSVIREEDHSTLKRIEEMSTAAKLESTLNMAVMKLHRAIEGMESEDRTDFMDVFEDIVAASAAPDESIDKQQLMYLAKMLGSGEREVREWMDYIRRASKDLHKITDGEEVRVEHGVDEDSVGELREILGDGF